MNMPAVVSETERLSETLLIKIKKKNRGNIINYSALNPSPYSEIVYPTRVNQT